MTFTPRKNTLIVSKVEIIEIKKPKKLPKKKTRKVKKVRKKVRKKKKYGK